MPESAALAMRRDCFTWGKTILEGARQLLPLGMKHGHGPGNFDHPAAGSAEWRLCHV
jgi:hypothetical protein